MMTGLRRWLLKTVLNRLHVPRDVTRFACRRHAERTALRQGERSLSYAELGTRVLHIATLWREWGIVHGSPVFCLLPDSIEQVVIRLAAAESGAMLTLLQPTQATSSLSTALEAIQPELIVHSENIPLPDYPSGRFWRYAADTALPHSRLAPTPDQRNLDPATVAALGFTSGTTGQPKALAISHGAYLTSLRQVVANIDLSQTRGWRSRTQDRFLVGIPLTGAGSGILLPALLSGACLTIPERYDADTLLDLLINQRINRFFTTPSLLIDLLDHPALRPLPDLQQLLYGTELMPAAKLEEAIARFGPVLQQGYGSAEVLPPVTLLTPKQHVVDDGTGVHRPAPRERLMSAGRVVPGVHIRIVDEQDRDLPTGETGEVLIQSPTVFTGYWRRPDLTSATLRNGYLVTGDMGKLSRDGYLTLLGRKADRVRRGDIALDPRPLEEAAHDHPAVKEASLVQVDEQILLAISLRRSYRTQNNSKTPNWADILQRHLQERLPETQIPDHVVIFPQDLPRSTLGKVLRRDVRAALEQKHQEQAS